MSHVTWDTPMLIDQPVKSDNSVVWSKLIWMFSFIRQARNVRTRCVCSRQKPDRKMNTCGSVFSAGLVRVLLDSHVKLRQNVMVKLTFMPVHILDHVGQCEKFR